MDKVKTVKAKTIHDLLKAVYKKEGWEYNGESRISRVLAEYGFSIDYENNRYVATKGN